MEVINVVVGVRWWIDSDSVYANAFEKQQHCLLESSELHYRITTNCRMRGLCLFFIFLVIVYIFIGPWFFVVCGIFLIFNGLSFVCWAFVRGVKTHWAQVGL